MESITLCVLGASQARRAEIASALGRKGSSSDMTIYNTKRERFITVIEPTRFPEKLPPFCYALQMADHAIIVYDGMSSAFGECLIASDLLKKPATFVISKEEAYREEELKKLLSQTSYKDAKIFIYDKPFDLSALVDGLSPAVTSGELAISVDAAFDVKGIGTVVLGFVGGDSVSKHDDLVVARTGAKCIVKSIQMQDNDFDSVPAGSRVGLALRGVKSDDLKRGDVFGKVKLESLSELANLEKSAFYQGEPKKIHVSSGFQFIASNFERGTIKLDTPIVKHTPALVVDLDAKQRIVGVVK